MLEILHINLFTVSTMSMVFDKTIHEKIKTHFNGKQICPEKSIQFSLKTTFSNRTGI